MVIVLEVGGNDVERRLPSPKLIRPSPSDTLYDPAWDRDLACCPELNSWLPASLGESAVSRMLVAICICVFSIWMQVAGWDGGQQAEGLHALSKLIVTNRNHEGRLGIVGKSIVHFLSAEMWQALTLSHPGRWCIPVEDAHNLRHADRLEPWTRVVILEVRPWCLSSWEWR